MLLLCFGYGYVAQQLAKRAPTVMGTSRTGESGTFAYDGSSLTPAVMTGIAQATHILISIPPHEGEETLARVIDEYATQCRWLGYVSTTGVYGDREGAPVTEDSLPAPHDELAEARVRSERLWRQHHAHIFRLAGIYGPGRSAFDAIRHGRGQIIAKPDHLFNRTHVEDIAAALWASMNAPTPGEIFNIADDLPAPQADVMRYAYRLLGQTPPPPIPFEAAVLSPMGRRFYHASRRVDASKIKKYHGINWKYPSFREGLAAILQESKS